MKRLIGLLLIAALLLACGGAAENAKKEHSADFAQRVGSAWEAAGYLDSMTAYGDVDLLDLYGIDLSVCRSGRGWADSIGYTNEAVLIAADEPAATEIETLLREHLEAQKETFRSYDPDAYRLAENAVLLRDGDLVLMIVSPDAQAMLETLRSVTP